MSPTELTKVRDALAGALSVDDINQRGRDSGQATRLRIVTPHRLFLAIVSALASARVESLADLLRTFNYQNGVHVAYCARRSESRPVRRSESRPPEGGSFYVVLT